MEERYSLNGLWRFAIDPENSGLDNQWMISENQPYLEAKTRTPVPSCWNRQTSKEFGSYHNTAWYWRTFQIPAHFNGRTVMMRFNGVVHNATIFIDGEERFQFRGGFMPFEFDVTAFADNNSHFLGVRIEGADDQDRYLKGTNLKTYNGILGTVELRAVEKIIMEDWHYNTKLIFDDDKKIIKYAEIEFSLYMKNMTDKEFKGNIEIAISKDFVQRAAIKKDVEILKNNTRLMKIIFHIDQPELWTPEDPNIMNINIHVWNNELNAIEISEIIGYREIKFENNQLLLNGKPYEIKGFDFEIDQSNFGFTLPETLIMDKLQRLKEIGVNTIRPNQGMLSPFIIEMASRLGFLVIMDLPLTTLSLAERDTFYTIYINNIKFMPALLCYTVTPRVDIKDPENMKTLQKLSQLITTKLDTTHLFVNEGYMGAKTWIRNEAEGFRDILQCQ